MRKLTILTAILLIAGLVSAELTRYPNGVAIADPYEVMQGTTSKLGTMGDGDMFVGADLQVVGKADLREVITRVETYTNLAAKTTCTVFMDDQISTGTFVGNVYYIVADDAGLFTYDNTVARNYLIGFDTDTAGAYIYGTTAFQGLNSLGDIVSENVVSSNAATMAQTSYAYYCFYGASTTITRQNVASCGFNIGRGDKIGLPGDVDETSGDVRVTVAGVDETAQVTVDTTYDTWVHDDVPDASDDYVVISHINSNTRNTKSANNHPY